MSRLTNSNLINIIFFFLNSEFLMLATFWQHHIVCRHLYYRMTWLYQSVLDTTWHNIENTILAPLHRTLNLMIFCLGAPVSKKRVCKIRALHNSVLLSCLTTPERSFPFLFFLKLWTLTDAEESFGTLHVCQKQWNGLSLSWYRSQNVRKAWFWQF